MKLPVLGLSPKAGEKVLLWAKRSMDLHWLASCLGCSKKIKDQTRLVNRNYFFPIPLPSTSFRFGTGERCALSAEELRGSLCKIICLRIWLLLLDCGKTHGRCLMPDNKEIWMMQNFAFRETEGNWSCNCFRKQRGSSSPLFLVSQGSD